MNETKQVDEWVKEQDFSTTEDIKVPDRLIDQVIGQEKAVEVMRKAAEQRRHVMLIGDPGTGKSMLAKAMSELLPPEELEDIIAYPNPDDNHQPRIRVVPAGKGKEIVSAQKAEAQRKQERKATMQLLVVVALIALGVAMFLASQPHEPMFLLLGLFGALILFMIMRQMTVRETSLVPKLLVSHTPGEKPPFVDGTGSHAGSLLGDVRHDPFQSGGLETPAHDRVEAGAIHKAHKGVLFIDEINMLRMESQQSLLTALQERKFPILGQSERSSGAMVKTESVPCDFVLVAAGNMDALKGQEGNPFHPGMHPALRSRIRGYGYEVFMNSTMDDSDENRWKLVRFVAQEVKKDTKIPHFDKMAVAEILRDAQRRSGRRGKLTLRLRELGGLVRVAGDVAIEAKAPLVTQTHVVKAKMIARSLEQQVVDQMIEHRREYRTFRVSGGAIGQVNGLAVFMGGEVGEPSGIVMPIAAEVTPSQSKSEGKVIATGKLGDIAREAVQNVAAVIKKHTGVDVTTHDIHIQFVLAHEGVEGDSASISVATAVISALEEIEVDQGAAMTGSLSIRGDVLPVGGVTAKIEAAAEAGLKKVIIPRANLQDVLIEERYRDRIKIVPVETLDEVLQEVLMTSPKKKGLVEKLAKFMHKTSTTLGTGVPGAGVPAGASGATKTPGL
ncbi:MAG TPA: ATP-dependent protease LonB [Candidatus Thermoplasmatota archaeon]|nr:ATP-dependent protease LonB [Candidatus Thermoplasmatota archaeon]